MKDTTLRSLVDMLCGKQLGSGTARTVFEIAYDSTKVVKIEKTSGTFQNVYEWLTWQELKDSSVAKYLAPCIAISDCGKILIQAKVQPFVRGPSTKVRMPAFLTDLKPSNYGIYNGHLVACDYGSNLALNHGGIDSKLRVVTWDDE